MSLPDPRTRGGEAALAALLADPARALVALDFDGTIAPVVDRPEDSRPAPGAVEALGRLARVVGEVAIVTGRPAQVAVDLGGFARAPGLDRLVVLGHYGLERWSGGSLDAPDPEPGVARVRAALPDLLAEAPDGVSVEDKDHSLVVHTRRAAAPQEAVDALRGPLRDLAEDNDLELVPGKFALELRPPGVDKGAALRGLVHERRPSAVLFAGDDTGDLSAAEAVRALREEGVPGLVVCSDSTETPAELRDAADLVVDGPPGLVELLDGLVGAIGSG